MAVKYKTRSERRRRRHWRIRKKIFGTPERPRLAVFGSLNHIYAQMIDDLAGHTIVSASTLDKEIAGKIKHGGNVEAAKLVGQLIAKRALEKGIKRVVFDRGGHAYHGRVKALADAVRSEGIEF
ncbi:MAG: 50S ribosomal protein L18 [Armatimonadota bacterium]|nr:50S ribosomal protein L18 [Armatimonadota bacterium]MCX7776916.1 50S ribosomal protein L18 [Armatimonadota bacterium]MDW8024749.1 50S ribosomal protein L18 [Armatimonadota bacterium]